ncbi:hypothetical protein BGZ70_004953 [Mortierella alpina]|uniref:Uncharacterized protein n=1 Tax=Mortierella alpina TaxID=64518 RepID=A0A9P6M6Y9_MORAP|nr:hypothetical protein BGZ70_004953 [Mortierella alpina]
MSHPHTQQPLDTPVPLADSAVPSADDNQAAAAEQPEPSALSAQTSHSIPPSEYVFQLILEQFWGDGVSKREIRSVYTTASDANAACHDYLLRTWPRDQFSLYEIGASPQRPELAKVSAQINGDRFHVWIERHSWEGILDFSSKAIARRVGKGPNAYILQRTIKDASGGKRRSTTRGIYATRQLAKQALAQDEPPPEWSSNQGYVLEPGGEYAHALSPSGKTAWLFIEVRPLYMSYTRLDQEEQEAAETQGQDFAGGHVGMSALNPISLDHGDDSMSSLPASPSAYMHPHRSSLDNPFSPMPSNPDEAGAFVYLVLQLKTIPYTPPILTVEAVAYELEVANRFGVALLENFTGAEDMSGPVYREDGCLQGSVEQRDRDEGLTVWVEKRAVVLGDEALDFDLMSEHGSVHSSKVYANSEQDPNSPHITAAASVGGDAGVGRRKRGEPESGFEAAGRSAETYPPARLTSLGAVEKEISQAKDEGPGARYKVVSITHLHRDQVGTESVSHSSSATAAGLILDSSNDLAVAILGARMQFYSVLAKLDITSIDVKDELERSQEEKGKVRSIQARSRSEPDKILQEVRVEDSQEQ